MRDASASRPPCLTPSAALHTVLPVARISDRTGFDEATNFVKFFLRDPALTPGAYRAA